MGKYTFFASTDPRPAIVLGGVKIEWDTHVLSASYGGETVTDDPLGPWDAAIISRSNARVSIVKCQLPADPTRLYAWCCGFYRGKFFQRENTGLPTHRCFLFLPQFAHETRAPGKTKPQRRRARAKKTGMDLCAAGGVRGGADGGGLVALCPLEPGAARHARRRVPQADREHITKG